MKTRSLCAPKTEAYALAKMLCEHIDARMTSLVAAMGKPTNHHQMDPLIGEAYCRAEGAYEELYLLRLLLEPEAIQEIFTPVNLHEEAV